MACRFIGNPFGRAFVAYEAAWIAARPFLRRNPRLRDGWDERTLRRPLPRSDLWIQAASAGEAYLARELFRAADEFPGRRVLATAGTRQGLDILAGIDGWRRAFFPLDQPSVMARAVERIRPRVAVLLETELWPGHLAALRSRDVPVLLLNGRITERSLRGYRRWPGLWRRLRPDVAAAVSPADAARFAALFGSERVVAMPNIKFDRISLETGPQAASGGKPSRADWFAADAPVAVLGSVRREEEAAAAWIVRILRSRAPSAAVALVPRHLHRVPAWTERLSRESVPWTLRSSLDRPVSAGTVAVWDTFGELDALYGMADAAFVGGSLAPLGGQNFMEPLAHGIVPVIGPSWSNFAWIGEAVFREGLAIRAAGAEDVAAALIAALEHPPDRTRVREKARAFLAARKGGATMAADIVWRYLDVERGTRYLDLERRTR